LLAIQGNPDFDLVILKLAHALHSRWLEAKMRIAIPLFHSRVSPHFAYAQEILLATKGEEGEWVKEKISCWHIGPLQKANLLSHLKINALICGGIHGNLLHSLECQGIQVVAGVMGEAEEALRLFAGGRLTPGAVVPGRCHRYRWRSVPPWLS
jgi:predicted Fe-Mo cluster-binding NifX family protein